MTEEQTYTRLREMTGTSEDDFDDQRLDRYLEESKVIDEDGNLPGDDDYETTYDLHRAAARIWRDRAAEIARHAFDTQVDMTRADRSDVFANFTSMARYHEQKMKPFGDSPFRGIGIEEEDEDNVSGDG